MSLQFGIILAITAIVVLLTYPYFRKLYKHSRELSDRLKNAEADRLRNGLDALADPYNRIALDRRLGRVELLLAQMAVYKKHDRPMAISEDTISQLTGLLDEVRALHEAEYRAARAAVAAAIPLESLRMAGSAERHAPEVQASIEKAVVAIRKWAGSRLRNPLLFRTSKSE